jgi:hypothetical protein
MTKKDILLLVVGLVVSLAISGVIYFYLFLETFDPFQYFSVKNPESIHGKILLTAVSTSFLTLSIAGLLRRLKYAAIGFAIPSLIGITLLILIGPTYISKSDYYETFDRQKWLTEKNDRLKMARQLIKSKELIDLTRDEVVEKLGLEYSEGSYISYKAWGDDCGLDIRFSDGKVVECWIFVKD